MRWQYFKVALLGCVLGFAGQVLVDMLCWLPCARTPIDALTDVGFESTLRWSYPKDPVRARPLVYETYLFYWLMVRGEHACRTGIIAGLGLGALVYTFDRVRKR